MSFYMEELDTCGLPKQALGENTIPPTTTGAIVRDIIKDGRRLSTKSCPLMYEWYGERYWGAAHGLAGIMHVLLDMDLTRDDKEYVKGTLCYMIQNRFPSGNYPATEGDNHNRLVHWCHGPWGSRHFSHLNKGFSRLFSDPKSSQAFALCFCFLSMQFGACVVKAMYLLRCSQKSDSLRQQRRSSGTEGCSKELEYVMEYAGMPTHFSLYRLTKNKEYLYRAKAFACFILDRANQPIAEGIMHSGDEQYSLFEGQAGMAYLFLDMINPLESRFPAYEL